MQVQHTYIYTLNGKSSWCCSLNINIHTITISSIKMHDKNRQNERKGHVMLTWYSLTKISVMEYFTICTNILVYLPPVSITCMWVEIALAGSPEQFSLTLTWQMAQGVHQSHTPCHFCQHYNINSLGCTVASFPGPAQLSIARAWERG